jgi:hypothetical protein
VLEALDPGAASAVERAAQRARDHAYDDAVLDGAAACGCRGLTR